MQDGDEAYLRPPWQHLEVARRGKSNSRDRSHLPALGFRADCVAFRISVGGPISMHVSRRIQL